MKIINKLVPLMLTAILMCTMSVFAETPADDSYEWPENPAETYELTVGVTVAENTPAGKALLAIDEALREESNGAVGLDIFWESTLGSSVELGEALVSGTIDIALISSAVISNYTKAIDVLSLPFIITNRDQIKTVIDDYFDDVTAGMPEKIGVPLGIWEFGFRHLFTKEKEVKCLEDMKGLTIRVMDGKLYSSTFEALGAIPTNISLSELVTAFQQGVVDGVELSLAAFVNQQQHTFCKYAAFIGYNYSVGCPTMSNDAFDRYPQEVTDLVQKVFWDYKYMTVDAGAEAEEEYTKTCEDAGMTINYFDDAEMEKLKEAVQPVWDSYKDIIGAELIENISSIQ